MGTALAALGIAALVLLAGDCAGRSNGNEPAQGQEWLHVAEQALCTQPPGVG